MNTLMLAVLAPIEGQLAHAHVANALTTVPIKTLLIGPRADISARVK